MTDKPKPQEPPSKPVFKAGTSIPPPQDVDELTDKTADGFVRHRCTCRFHTVLGAHGFDQANRYCYKIVIRDRVVIVYFGAFVVICKDCSRWHRVRLLPREQRVEIRPLKTPGEKAPEMRDDGDPGATLSPEEA